MDDRRAADERDLSPLLLHREDLARDLGDDRLARPFRRDGPVHELKRADLPRPLGVDHTHPGLAHDDGIAGLYLRYRFAKGPLLRLIDHDVAVHLDMLDRQPFIPVLHERRMIGGRVEPLREDPVTLCRYKGDIADLGGACAKPVQLGEDGVELPPGGCRHTQPRVTCIRLLLPDVEYEDLKLPTHIHDPVKHEGHDARIDDMPLEFDLPA
ncbi:hypothetical protein DSECCO2_594010 [anaerobic digester metagenome]